MVMIINLIHHCFKKKNGGLSLVVKIVVLAIAVVNTTRGCSAAGVACFTTPT
jgi:hypothetical protein